MSSTSTNVGFSGERPSSRVLRPPGGGHTDIFRNEPEPQRTGRRIYANIPSSFEQEKAGNNETPEANSAAPPVENVQPNSVAPPVENGGANSEASLLAVASAPPPAQTSAPAAPNPEPAGRRGRVPPGGFSSKLW